MTTTTGTTATVATTSGGVVASPSRVSVCIVNYNTGDDVTACLESLHRVTFDGVEIVVVDNASTDDSVPQIRRRFPAVRVIESESNVGFGRGCNLAGSVATSPWLLFLNPDTVVDPGFIEPLLDLATRRPDAGLYGGRTLRPDGAVDPRSCWGLPTLWSTFCFATGLSTAFAGHPRLDAESLGTWARDSERDVGMVTGCLLLVSSRVWEQLGGFDERYFMYGEDADLSRRARNLGYRPMISPDAVVTHHVGTSSTVSGKLVLLYTGKATYIRHHFPVGADRLGISLLKAGVGLRFAAYAVARRGGALGEAYRVLWRRRAEWSAGWT